MDRRRHAHVGALALGLVAGACGPGAVVGTAGPDDPATVEVVVFLRDRTGNGLHVWFPSTPDELAGSDASTTGAVAVSCAVVPAGATVAVVAPTTIDSILDLYTAANGDADQALWVDQAPDGGLLHGSGRPAWATVDPSC